MSELRQRESERQEQEAVDDGKTADDDEAKEEAKRERQATVDTLMQEVTGTH